jgi:hypothetical protein
LPSELTLSVVDQSPIRKGGSAAQALWESVQLAQIAERYGTTDVGVVTNCYAFEDRARSYELLAASFGLTPP